MLDGELLLRIFWMSVDIILVWYVLYKLIMLIRGTKAIQLLKGIVVIVVVRMTSVFLNLQTLKWLTDQVLLWGFLAIIILFQPELRRALEQLGRGNIFARSSRSEEEKLAETIDAIIESVNYMAKRRIGAIITIERETGIGEYAETGIPIGGKLTHQLLTNIFTPNTPLHDGAVIVSGENIVAAACYLPLSESPLISKDLGTRHRSAVVISQVKDDLTIIVSEETGDVKGKKNGGLHRDLSEEEPPAYLEENLSVPGRKSKDKKKAWSWRGRKPG